LTRGSPFGKGGKHRLFTGSDEALQEDEEQIDCLEKKGDLLNEATQRGSDLRSRGQLIRGEVELGGRNVRGARDVWGSKEVTLEG